MTTNDVIAVFKKLALGGYGKRLRAHRDWFVLIIVMLLALIGSLAWNVWFFLSAVERDLAETTEATVQASLDRSVLDEARMRLDEQAAEEVQYRDGYQFVDPSL